MNLADIIALWFFGAMFVAFITAMVTDIADLEWYEGKSAKAVLTYLFFWPLTIILLVLSGIPEALGLSGKGDKLSRRQRRTLEFERQRAAIAQKALETQREYERLVTNGLD